MFLFGAKSLKNMVGVHPDLVRVNNHAVQVTTQDFGCECGVRSDAAQLDAFLRKASKLNGIAIGAVVNGVKGTGRGNHQINLGDGLGHAVDDVPYVGGVILWAAAPPAEQWRYIYPVADAMRAAAIAEKVRVRWGGVWDRLLNDLPAGPDALAGAVKAYQARHAGGDFLDGPHFEIVPG